MAMVHSSRRGFIGGAAAGIAGALLPSPVRATGGFDSFVAEQMAAARIPGLALGIARDGAVSFTRAYGYADLGRRQPATTDTMFHIASITKVITAQAVMLLVDEGTIALDDPIAPHLDFAILGEAAAAITFRHLLMHMSGISDEHYYEIDFRQRGADSPMEIGALLRGYLVAGGRYARAGNLKHAPGAQWDYCNIGYALLGYLVGRIAGKDMRDLTRERLFRPLRLGHVAWTISETPARLRATPYDLVDGAVTPVEPVGFPDWPAGMMRASIDDLALLVAAAANGGVARSIRLSSEAGTAEMLGMQRPPGLPDWLTGQGLGWQQSLLDGVPRINHWGGDPGVFTMAYLDPARRSAIVILSNLSITPESRTALKAIAARMLA
jgi:CubicO group peptidase (beta-lactamase class C family)